jgi:hypothetical protein
MFGGISCARPVCWSVTRGFGLGLTVQSYDGNVHPPDSSQALSVMGFLETVRRHRSELARGLGWEDGADVLRRLIERVGGGWMPRRGVAGRISYTVHGGIGCRLCEEDEDGVCVDGDLLPDGRFFFDIWRIRQYAESMGMAVPPDEVVKAECAMLLRKKVLRPHGKRGYSAAV